MVVRPIGCVAIPQYIKKAEAWACSQADVK